MGVLGNALKAMTKAGYVNGHDFPRGSYLNFGSDRDEKFFLITYPNKTEERITHDMIKAATVLAMSAPPLPHPAERTAASIAGRKM